MLSDLDILCSSTHTTISIHSASGQRRPRSACANAQADQGLLVRKLHKGHLRALRIVWYSITNLPLINKRKKMCVCVCVTVIALKRSKYFPFILDPFQKGGKTLRDLSPLPKSVTIPVKPKSGCCREVALYWRNVNCILCMYYTLLSLKS